MGSGADTHEAGNLPENVLRACVCV
jgi:hypothetical protein